MFTVLKVIAIFSIFALVMVIIGILTKKSRENYDKEVKKRRDEDPHFPEK